MCHQLPENWYNISNLYSNSEDTPLVLVLTRFDTSVNMKKSLASQTCLQEQEQEEEEAYLPHAGVVGG